MSGERETEAQATEREILKARARALAAIPKEEDESGTNIKIIEFKLAKERYAVEHRFVREVQQLSELTPIPGTPPFLIGIVNVRSQILPVIDIKKFFDLPETGITDLHATIIVQAAGIELGILADLIIAGHSLPVAKLQPSLPTLTGIRAEYLKGVTADGLVVLDVARILSDPKIVVKDSVGY